MTAMASTFLTFVALNTLVFLGLSIAKVITWPHMPHPRALRSSVTDEGIPKEVAAPQRILLSAALALDPGERPVPD